MFFVFFVVIIITDMSAAHVFCQDAHATRWTPLGYSCPVNCATVVVAVKRLREKDIEEFYRLHQTRYVPNITTAYEEHYTEESDEIQHQHYRNDIKESKRPSPSHYRELYNILLNKRSGNELQALSKIASDHLMNNSSWSSDKMGGNKHKTDLNKKWVKKSVIQEDFLQNFTAILNKYSTAEFFNEDLTAMMLKKLISNRVGVHLGLFDVQKILQSVRQAMFEHSRLVRAGGAVTTLQSKYCLNVYVPGCFCIPGFVEANGECVTPRDCFIDPDNSIKEYLTRVIVN